MYTGAFWAFLLLGLVFLLGSYNGLCQSRSQVRKAWSQIKVQMKRRHDLVKRLIPMIGEGLVKEFDLPQKLNQAQYAVSHEDTPCRCVSAEEDLIDSVQGMLGVSLKGHPVSNRDQLVTWQEEWISTQNRIIFLQQFYNDCVMMYNIKLNTLPFLWFASLAGHRKERFFEIKNSLYSEFSNINSMA